jgi:hypothetical protein
VWFAACLHPTLPQVSGLNMDSVKARTTVRCSVILSFGTANGYILCNAREQHLHTAPHIRSLHTYTTRENRKQLSAVQFGNWEFGTGTWTGTANAFAIWYCATTWRTARDFIPNHSHKATCLISHRQNGLRQVVAGCLQTASWLCACAVLCAAQAASDGE